MEDLKTFILDKAQERFDRFGYKKTTMDEISRDCKISKKTIYENFKDKEDLFTSLFRRECHKANQIIFAKMGEISDPAEKLKALIRTSLWYFKQDNFLTRILKDDDALLTAFLIDKSHSIADEEIISNIAAILREGKAVGKFRDVDEQVVAYAGLKLFESFSYMRTMEFSPEKEEQGYYTDVLIDFVMNALLIRKEA